MSTPNFEQLAGAQKANLEVMMALVRTALSGVERLTALNMTASREFFNNAVSTTQQFMGAKDAGDFAKLNADLAKPGVDKLMDYSRSLYDLASQMQREIVSVVEGQYSSFARNASSAVEKASANAPIGGDVFAAAMNSMLSASTKAFDNMNAMARQFADIAEANIEAASGATARAASATSAAAKKSSGK